MCCRSGRNRLKAGLQTRICEEGLRQPESFGTWVLPGLAGQAILVAGERIEDRAVMDLIRQSVRRLRVIEVGKADYCPCGGTHVKNVREIGPVHVLGKRSKGKETDRVEYELLS